MPTAKLSGSYLLWALLLSMIGFVALIMLGAAGLGLIGIVAPQRWPEGLQVHTFLRGFDLPTVTAHGRATYCAKLLLQCSMVELVLVPLAGIVHTLVKRMPFVAGNVIRLQLIAGVFFLVVVIRLIAPLLAPVWTMIWLEMEPSPRLDLYALCVALLGLTLAEIFREGLVLRVEAEGTI